MPGRYSGGNQYRYGYQGSEKDDEITGVEGSHVSFDLRIHDTRLGRFLSIDPLTAKYPHNSPYAFSENRVIDMVELEGAETFPFQLLHDIKTRYTNSVLKGGDDDDVIKNLNIIEAYAKKLTVEGIAIETSEGLRNMADLIRKAKDGELSKAQINALAAEAGKGYYAGIVEKKANAILNHDVVQEAEADAEILQVGLFAALGAAGLKLPSTNFSKVINSGKQGKHILGHNNYIKGRSILKANAQNLLDDFHAGNFTSSQVINETKIRVDFGKIIGNFVDQTTGKSVPTTRGIVINSKTGVHIVPSAPL